MPCHRLIVQKEKASRGTGGQGWVVRRGVLLADSDMAPGLDRDASNIFQRLIDEYFDYVLEVEL